MRPAAGGRHPDSEGDSGSAVSPVPRRHRVRPWRLATLGIVALVVGIGFGQMVASAAGYSPFPTGHQSAVFVITIGGKHPTFTGTVAGRHLTGEARPSPPNVDQGNAVDETGTLGGVKFLLLVSLVPLRLDQHSHALRISFKVTGHYGSATVKATAAFVLTNKLPTAKKLLVPVHGHVGTQSISGMATVVPKGEARARVTAVLTIA